MIAATREGRDAAVRRIILERLGIDVDRRSDDPLSASRAANMRAALLDAMAWAEARARREPTPQERNEMQAALFRAQLQREGVAS